jgi:hypothetical protein
MNQLENYARTDKPTPKQINNVRVRYEEAIDFVQSLVPFLTLGDLTSPEARVVLAELLRRRSLATKLLANDTWVTEGRYPLCIPMHVYDEAMYAIAEMTLVGLDLHELEEFEDLVLFPEQFGLCGIVSGSAEHVELMFENAQEIDRGYDSALAKGVRFKSLERIALRKDRSKVKPKYFREIMKYDILDVELLDPAMITDRTLVPFDASGHFSDLDF